MAPLSAKAQAPGSSYVAALPAKAQPAGTRRGFQPADAVSYEPTQHNVTANRGFNRDETANGNSATWVRNARAPRVVLAWPPGNFVANGGDGLRFQLHRWRRFRLLSPPMATSLQLCGRRAVLIAHSITWPSYHGLFSTHGDEIRYLLHPCRRCRILPPPMAMPLPSPGRSAAIIAHRLNQDSCQGFISIHGDELRLQFHL